MRLPDSTVVPSLVKSFPECTLCNAASTLALGEWNFKTGNAFVCGKVDNAGFIGNTNTTFTFFGPSACSVDTGIVVTVHLPVPFDRDRRDITTSRTAFYYYDHHATRDIFISLSPAIFTITVDSFVFATRVATGTFTGTVYKANGDTAMISDGHYKVKLK